MSLLDVGRSVCSILFECCGSDDAEFLHKRALVFAFMRFSIQEEMSYQTSFVFVNDIILIINGLFLQAWRMQL